MTTAGFMVYTLYVYGRAIHYSSIVHACASTTKSNLMPAIFLAPAAFECTLFFLTGYRAWRDVKLMTNTSSAPFLTVLYRDGIACFFIMIGVRIWNVWIYATQPITTAYLGIYLLWATMTILSTRVYLNLQFLARGGRNDTETEFTTFGQPKFAVPTTAGMTTTNAIFGNLTQGDFEHYSRTQENQATKAELYPTIHSSPTYGSPTTSRSKGHLDSLSSPSGRQPFSAIS
ncbi:hypothetical protein FRC17_006585, partial [Serendipita sp. 399]